MTTAKGSVAVAQYFLYEVAFCAGHLHNDENHDGSFDLAEIK